MSTDTVSTDSVSTNTMSTDTVSTYTVFTDTVSTDTVFTDAVSTDTVPTNPVSCNTVSTKLRRETRREGSKHCLRRSFQGVSGNALVFSEMNRIISRLTKVVAYAE